MKVSEKAPFLKEIVDPMLQSLVFDRLHFDVTRLNLGATGFCDLDEGLGSRTSVPLTIERGVVPYHYKSQACQSQEATRDCTPRPVKDKPRKLNSGTSLKAEDIDPAVLEELPPHIRAQVEQSFGFRAAPTKRRKTRIDDFFQPRK
jgi:hypothetical protein